ncbi:hypothetical protein B8W99_04645 [Peribacillus simplex]|nr:hypothetical protein B8W99_04645 [Peribacillus simplex]
MGLKFVKFLSGFLKKFTKFTSEAQYPLIVLMEQMIIIGRTKKDTHLVRAFLIFRSNAKLATCYLASAR